VFGCFQGHGFEPIWAGINMTVATGLVAEFSNIDLKDGDACRVQRRQACLMKLGIKREMRGRLGQHSELFGRRGKGILSSQQGQWHGYARTIMSSSGMDHMHGARLGCGQDGFWESQFTASKVERLPLAIGEGPLHHRCDSIADLLSFSYAFHYTGIPQNTQVVRHVRLRIAQFLYQVRDTLLFGQE